MRYKFWDVFRESEDGEVLPRGVVNLGGTLVPAGGFPGTYDLQAIKGHDLEADLRKGVFHVRGYYIHTVLASINPTPS